MWISYLIIAILIGSTIMWWVQDIDASKKQVSTPAVELTDALKSAETNEIVGDATTVNELNETANVTLAQEQQIITSSDVSFNDQQASESNVVEQPPAIAKAIFTFSGDCWVSIYDATGERIAYGVKKTGYVMTITGKAPFKVDIGRPALTSIEFNGEAIDMSQFDKDNIAKFTLPITID